MKRILLAGILVINVLVSLACKPITMEQKQKDKQDGEVNIVQYDDVKELDFSTGYVKGQLKENLYIDAVVPTEVPNELWDYEIYKKEIDEDKTEAQYTDEIALLVDQYYDEDITVTFAELQNKERGNVFYNGNWGYLELGEMDTAYFDRLNTIDDNFPEYEMDFDKQQFDEIIDEFLEVMKPVIPDNMGTDYVCVHWNEEYKMYINEKYGEASAFETLWEWEEANPQYATVLTDFYLIRLYTMIDGVKLKTYNNLIRYEWFEGEIVDEACRFIESEMGSIPIMIAYRHYLDICMDESGKIIGFRLADNYDIGEQLRKNSIISPEEAVEKFYDSVQSTIISKETTIKYVNLNYMVVVEDADENKYRNAYITPVWEIQIYEEGKPRYRIAILSAVDGTILQSAY